MAQSSKLSFATAQGGIDFLLMGKVVRDGAVHFLQSQEGKRADDRLWGGATLKGVHD